MQNVEDKKCFLRDKESIRVRERNEMVAFNFSFEDPLTSLLEKLTSSDFTHSTEFKTAIGCPI